MWLASTGNPHHGQNCFVQAARNSERSGSSYSIFMRSLLGTKLSGLPALGTKVHGKRQRWKRVHHCLLRSGFYAENGCFPFVFAGPGCILRFRTHPAGPPAYQFRGF
jgi:hypothetical protein